MNTTPKLTSGHNNHAGAWVEVSRETKKGYLSIRVSRLGTEYGHGASLKYGSWPTVMGRAIGASMADWVTHNQIAIDTLIRTLNAVHCRTPEEKRAMPMTIITDAIRITALADHLKSELSKHYELQPA